MEVVPPQSGFSLEPVGPDDTDNGHLLICAACGRKTDTVPCGLCGRNPLLEGRYRLEAIVPDDTAGLVYDAADLRRAGRKVRIRIVPLRSEAIDHVRQMHSRWLDAWRGVSHPTLRGWLDAFLVGGGRTRALGLVQVHADHPTLESTLGHPWSVAQTTHLLEHLLEGLVLLHGARVPMSCGRLSRSRVGWSADGGPLVLHPVGVERFGDRASDARGEPPELRTSGWVPASDIYRVAALGVRLLTGRSVSHLLDARGEWDWERHADTTPLVAVLRAWLQPTPADRPPSAAAALRVLRAHDTPVFTEADTVTIDPPVDDVHPGVAAVRIPLSEQPSKPVQPAARSSTRGPRRMVAQSAGGPTSAAPDPTSALTRWITLATTVVIVLATLLSLQIALTATGMVPGKPWISIDTRSASSR